MSRITGSDALKMFEAYAAVYAPQELTEEQIWEEVENWVNSLLEEGYDLSEYTWEEMYESYLTERPNVDPYGVSSRAQPKGEVVNLPKVKGAITGGDVTLNRGYASTLGGRKGEVTYQKKDNVVTRSFRRTGMRPTGVSNIPTGTKNSPYTLKNLGGDQFKAYKAGGGDAAMAKGTGTAAEIIARGRKASSVNSGSTSASVAPRPAASAPAAPKVTPKPAAATKPALGPTGKPLVGGIERRTPTRSEMDAAKAYRTPAATTGTLGAATAAATKTPAAFGSTSTAPEIKAAAKTTPAPVAPKAPMAGRDQMLQRNLKNGMEYDAYDLVLEYLLSQGHAETVEEAHYVMMEMDAEMIGSIVEGVMPELIDPTAHNKSQRFATQQGKIRALQSGAATSGEKSAAQSKLKGPQLPGV
jgi:hypothetical protein